MYHHVRLMMYYMDAAGFAAPVLRHSGGVRMNEQKGGREEETYPP